VLVEGKHRARILQYATLEPFFRVDIEQLAEATPSDPEIDSLMRTVRTTFENYVKLNKRIPPEMLASVASIEDASRLGDTIVAHLSLKLIDKQKILETEDPADRLQRLLELMQAEIEILQVERKIRSRVKKQIERTQRDNYLNDQVQQIQKELGGEKDEFKNEIEELEEKIRNKKMSDEAADRLKRELKKLKMMSPMSAEATVVRNYIDWVIGLPWFDKTEEQLDIERAERILNADHYGLKKPKERILEYLSVHKLVSKVRGPILCFVGPPGVGKTSLARSIALSTNRKFVRLSLGGVRDEAEIRGHRRTYIGALPGKIAQSLKKVGTNNRCSSSTRSTRWRWTSAAIRRPRSSRSSTPSRTTRSTITTSISTTTFRTSCSSRRPITSTRSRCRSRIDSRSSSCPATPSGRRSRSPAST
jgi:ATP-dependent Lon protease